MKIFAADVWVDDLEGVPEDHLGTPLSADLPDLICIAVVPEETTASAVRRASPLYPSPAPFVPGTPPATIAELSAPAPYGAMPYGAKPGPSALELTGPVPSAAPANTGRWRMRYKNTPPVKAADEAN